MNLETKTNFIIRAATIVTFICFFTGFEICYKIWKKRSTKDISPVPFMFGFINTTLWLYYGILTKNETIISTNSIGFGFFAFYNLFFYFMSTHRHSITKQYLVAIISLYLLYNIPIYSKEPIKIIGFLASSFNVAFFASPLTQIRIVLKTKNAESLPFLLILVSFISSLLWFYYGLLINDVFIKIPNLLAIFILGFELVLYLVYYKSPSNQIFLKKSEVNQNQNFEFFNATKDDPTVFISKFKIDNQDSPTKFNNLLKLIDDEDKKKCYLIYTQCSTFDEFCKKFIEHFNEIYYFNLRKLDNDFYEEKNGRLTDFVRTKIKSHQTLYPNTPTETLIKQVCSKLPLEIAKNLLHMPEFELDAFLVKVQILESILDEEKNEEPDDTGHIPDDNDSDDDEDDDSNNGNPNGIQNNNGSNNNGTNNDGSNAGGSNNQMTLRSKSIPKQFF